MMSASQRRQLASTARDTVTSMSLPSKPAMRLLLLLLIVSYSTVESFITQQQQPHSSTLQQYRRLNNNDNSRGSSSLPLYRGEFNVNKMPTCFSQQTKNLLISQSGATFSYRKSSLYAFLPPGGGGGGGRRDDNITGQIKDIGSIALVLGGILLFFVSPLGALFFTVMNSLLVLSFVIPVVGILSFTIWSYFNTITGVCPNCGTPVKVPKDESPSLCLNCGTVLQSKNGIIAVANLNNDGGMFQREEESIFSFFRPPSRNDNMRGGPSIRMYDVDIDDDRDDDYDEYQRRQRMRDRIIDVDVEPDEPRRRWW
jgi:hypothetical protein